MSSFSTNFGNYLFSDDMRVNVALGRVPDWRIHRKFGMNAGVPATGSEEIWPVGTARVLPSAAAVASCVSTSAEDDPDEATPPGTGAHEVVIEGLDGSYNEVTETVTLTGTTPSLSTATFLRINRAYIRKCGTNDTNVGAISISVGGDLQAYIEADEGQTHQTHYTVPANHSVVVTGFSIVVGRMGGASADCQVESQIKLWDATDNLGWRTIDDQYLFGPITDINEQLAVVLPEKCEIRQKVTSGATTQVSSTWSGYLVKTA